MAVVTPLEGGVGARVTDVDLSRPLSPEEQEELVEAWRTHHVLVFPGQDLAVEDQVRFAEYFGPLGELAGAKDKAGPERHVMHIANREVDGKKGNLPDGEMYFHFDQCYLEAPVAGCFLYGIEIPSKGGNTLFADTVQAFATLPSDLQQRLLGLDALNVYDYLAQPTTRGAISNPDAARYVHPAVTFIPETGERALFVNRLMTDSLVGLDRDESEALLEQTFDHAEQRRFVYEHVWSKGDLVLWDNRTTMHARTDFDPREARVLRRISTLGSKPVAAREAAAATR
jgi:taurine dioxygenase